MSEDSSSVQIDPISGDHFDDLLLLIDPEKNGVLLNPHGGSFASKSTPTPLVRNTLTSTLFFWTSCGWRC
ncbi:MAG: hypothetical protein OSB18_04145 [SAR324 cluster bacterium]|nr:hypothetical protein [SAR324 cluster bacterium]